jgi:hypothetical protein
MIETTILEYFHKLPDSLQQEVLHYTQFCYKFILKALLSNQTGFL